MSNNLAKIELINTFDFVSENSGHKLIVQTALGQYAGRLYTQESDEEFSYISKILELYTENRQSEFDENNPTAIALVDVTLRSPTNVEFKMPFVFLFVDQILGVTIGSYDKPIE